LKVDKKIRRLIVTAFLLVAALLLCDAIYRLFDSVMNGFVVDWFEGNYVSVDWHPLKEGEGYVDGYFTKSIQWWKVKRLMLKAFTIFILLWVLSTRMVSVLYASFREKQILRRAGDKIGEFMHHTREASEVFPGEYAPISVQMAQIKATMQRHEQTLKEEAGRKNDLITYLAHDMKTPLTSVIGYLSLLEEAPDMPEAQKEKYVHITLDKALRLEKLINEFFEITRYNLQQIMLEKETVDLPFMLMQMTDEFYPVLSAHGNSVKLEVEAGEEKREISLEENPGDPICGKDILVYADAEKLARVFNNILKNAVAYSYPGTEITVSCRQEPDHVEIRFSNRGKTIPRQKLDYIFEKFFRLDDARTTNTGGAGLGLAIAREIVNLHGGSITADSENEVTTFTVKLPMVL